MNTAVTIKQAMQQFIETVSLARRKNTADTYAYAMRAFSSLLADNKIDIETTPVAELSEDAIGWFATWLKGHSPATEQLYLQAASGF